MRYNAWHERLTDVLNELWAELSEKLFGPKPELKPVPVREKKDSCR